MLILTEYQALEKAFFTKAVNYKLESTQKSTQKNSDKYKNLH